MSISRNIMLIGSVAIVDVVSKVILLLMQTLFSFLNMYNATQIGMKDIISHLFSFRFLCFYARKLVHIQRMG